MYSSYQFDFTDLLQGLLMEMTSVSLLDLRTQMNITYEQAGRALGTRAIGLFIGALTGGFIHEVNSMTSMVHIY